MQMEMATDLRISISTSNLKTKTASISLPPGPQGTCRKDVPCWGRGKCYAFKMWAGDFPYMGVAKAWQNNLEVLQADRAGYWEQLDTFLKALSKRPEANRFFRFHVGGDCPDMEYVYDVVDIAGVNPLVAFTLYTKQYDWWLSCEEWLHIPQNLTVMFSAWPGLELPEQDIFPVVWMLDPKDPDPRIPQGLDVCPGSCPVCRWCWDPNTTGCTILKH
jgi:hypothetical protein